MCLRTDGMTHGRARRWWQDADAPWQCLAACMEVRDALASGDPASFRSRLPVQMDGSCNGLQHYAALSRDEPGGRSVNLLPVDRPQAGTPPTCLRAWLRARAACRSVLAFFDFRVHKNGGAATTILHQVRLFKRLVLRRLVQRTPYPCLCGGGLHSAYVDTDSSTLWRGRGSGLIREFARACRTSTAASRRW